MKLSIFISYSRRQTPFVDSLQAYLEKSGYSIWLDYHNLVPAKPWYKQILSGISESDVFLLVVSKESMESKNVEPEWRLALELKKRIVLLIFEAVPLPAELQETEWIDFRVNNKRTYRKLIVLLGNGGNKIVSVPPQQGFKAPAIFWITIFLSVVLAIGSFPAWWTIIIPYILIPLPWQIYKRNYVLSRAIPAILLFPVFSGEELFSGDGFLGHLGAFYFSDNVGGLVVIVGWILVALLLTPIMQTRGRPEAAQLRFRKTSKITIDKSRSVNFNIECAYEDGRYAEQLRRRLEEHGHCFVDEGHGAEVVFVLISTYNTQSKYDPDSQVVIPVILQDVDGIEPKLQRIQWLDFRKGIRHIDKLAALLPEPEKLLKAMSIPPAGTQEIFPVSVNLLQYFFLLTSSIAAGGFLLTMLGLGVLLFTGHFESGQIHAFVSSLFFGFLSFGFLSSALRGLRTRRGGVTAVYPLVIVIIYQLFILFMHFVINSMGSSENVPNLGLFLAASFGSFVAVLFVFPAVFLLTLIILLFRWREFYLWLPRQQSHSPTIFERIMLLYPLSRKRFAYQVIFHLSLFISLVYFQFFLGFSDLLFFFCCSLPLILTLSITYWQAQRPS